MRNAAAKTVWPLCETPSATSMAPVGVSSTKIPPYLAREGQAAVMVMMVDAVCAAIQRAHMDADGLEEPERQLVGGMAEHGAVERHMTLEQMRPERMRAVMMLDTVSFGRL